MDAETYTAGPYAISMHQPWASLLVYGVKRIEGRSWPTTFRGRLWIQATSVVPKADVIQETTESYRQVWALEGVQPKFPEQYPTSALLGCVDVVDCLPVECIEAWPGIPDSVRSEVGSPYGFLCDNPRRLVVPRRMSGSFKIWSFSGKIARDMEPALRAAPQHGKEAWTWKAYTVPEGLASAKLPRSANHDKWQKQYGSPMAQRSKQAAADKALLGSGGQSGTLVERWKSPAPASPGASEDNCSSPSGQEHSSFGQFRPRAVAMRSGAAEEGNAGGAKESSVPEVNRATNGPAGTGELQTSVKSASGVWGASPGGTTWAERLRSLHHKEPPSGFLPGAKSLGVQYAACSLHPAEQNGGAKPRVGENTAQAAAVLFPPSSLAAKGHSAMQHPAAGGSALPGIRPPMPARHSQPRGGRQRTDTSELLAARQPQTRLPAASEEVNGGSCRKWQQDDDLSGCHGQEETTHSSTRSAESGPSDCERIRLTHVDPVKTRPPSAEGDAHGGAVAPSCITETQQLPSGDAPQPVAVIQDKPVL